MTKQSRCDILKFDSVEVTSAGFIRFPVYAGRTGIQLYRNRDGSVRKEYRPPEEVFKRDTMNSLKGVVATNNHPPEMVNLDNVKKYQVGFGSDNISIVTERGDELGYVEGQSYPDGKFQKTFVTITDKKTINEINEGKVEVSLGYDVKLDTTAGVFDGHNYDAVQRDIICNHLAIVDKARGGEDVRLRLDRFDAIMFDEKPNKPSKEKEMEKMKIGDKEYDMDKELKDAIKGMMKEKEDEMAKLKKDMSGKEEEKKDAQKKLDSLEAERDALKEKLDQAKGRVDSEEVAKLAKARVDLLSKAAKVLKEDKYEEVKEKSDIEIKKAVINACSAKEVNFDGKSEDYIDARFDAAYENNVEATKAVEDASTGYKKDGQEGEAKTAAEIREENMRKDSEAWTKPIGRTINK